MLVRTTSRDPIEVTLPSTLKEDEAPEATAKAHRDLGLLGQRTSTDVCAGMTRVSIVGGGMHCRCQR